MALMVVNTCPCMETKPMLTPTEIIRLIGWGLLAGIAFLTFWFLLVAVFILFG